jgi:hypothetical protein
MKKIYVTLKFSSAFWMMVFKAHYDPNNKSVKNIEITDLEFCLTTSYI